MNFKFSTTLSILSCSLLITGCAQRETKASDQQKSEQRAPTEREQAVSQMQMDRDAYTQRVDAKISKYQEHAQMLRSQSESAQPPRKKKLENAAEDMDSALKDVSKSLNEVKNSAPENWLDYKRDVERAMNRADSLYSNSTSLLQ